MSSLVPRVGVGTIIFHEDDVCLIRRGQPPLSGGWSLPGGKLELGEPLVDAAHREAFEETGLDVRIGGFVGHFEWIERDTEGTVLHHYVLIDYWGEATNPAAIRAGDDAVDARWFAISTLGTLDLWSDTVAAIHRAVQLREDSRQ